MSASEAQIAIFPFDGRLDIVFFRFRSVCLCSSNVCFNYHSPFEMQKECRELRIIESWRFLFWYYVMLFDDYCGLSLSQCRNPIAVRILRYLYVNWIESHGDYSLFTVESHNFRVMHSKLFKWTLYCGGSLMRRLFCAVFIVVLLYVTVW